MDIENKLKAIKQPIKLLQFYNCECQNVYMLFQKYHYHANIFILLYSSGG